MSKMEPGGSGRSNTVRKWKKWCRQVEAAFLDELAATCNVTASARKVGVHFTTAYEQRRTRPEFERRWKAALQFGYWRLESELLNAALDSLDDTVAFDADRPIARMSPEMALKVLAAHRGEIVHGESRRRGWQARPRRFEDVEASIRAKADAIIAARRADGAGGDPAEQRR